MKPAAAPGSWPVSFLVPFPFQSGGNILYSAGSLRSGD
jgi:hypothetical protein